MKTLEEKAEEYARITFSKALDTHWRVVKQIIADAYIAGAKSVVTDNRKIDVQRNNDLEKLTRAVIDRTLFCSKEVLTTQETARYMGISMSYLYKLTSRRIIPHYKTTGKLCFFNRIEIEQWLQTNRVSTTEELDDSVNKYLYGKRKDCRYN